MSILVIVESPGKIKKIQHYLDDIENNKYIVKASVGHCRDLHSDKLSIDIDNNYKPEYTIIKGKNKVINDLKKQVEKSSHVILAADDDREGEMIASSLKDLLKLKNYSRIIFHEITKNSLEEALKNPIDINYDMVYAQQARRLLDRLVGFKISPLLWKQIKGGSSAGRVQSVIVKIIIDKELEIQNSISNPFYKTISEFQFKNKKFKGTLYQENKKDIYQFENKDDAINFLKSITDKDVFKVKQVEDKETYRTPPLPFTTSSLQQEAYTRLRFSSKKTMSLAQKLYENGLITYMRTDSTLLSKECVGSCKKYIIETFGEEYSQPRNKNKASKNAQGAHEAIRPTYISKLNCEGKLGKEYNDLYKLIWKRTVASQMTSAVLDVKTVYTKLGKKLPDNSLFVSVFEEIKFNGYLVLYNDKDEEEENNKMIKIEKGDKLGFNNITIKEEYTKLPLRYNEAGLVKYLEKQGIGRPSTYASFMSRIIEKGYVETSNISGVKKESNELILNSKLKLKEKLTTITVGKENKKLVPTELGRMINNFLIEHFDNIMDINFTAEMESNLDKIANGKAKWFNVLDLFYRDLEPKIKQLEEESKDLTGNLTDELFGEINGVEIFKGIGKHGPYLKIKKDKWIYAPLKDSNISLEDALKLFEYPKLLGKIERKKVELCKGKYGLYVKCGGKNYSVDKKLKEDEIDIEYVNKLLNKSDGDPYALKSFKYADKTINIKKGPYGLYAQMIGKKKKNISLPNNLDIEKLTIEELISYIAK